MPEAGLWGLAGAMTTSDTGPDRGYAPPPPGYAAPPTDQRPPRPPLRRTTGEDKVVAGVAAGVARTLGIDPILVRVGFVVLTIFGGSGLVLYVAGWLLVPEDGRTQSSGERFIRDNNALVVAAVVVLAILLLGPLVLWRIWDGGFGFGGLVLLLLAVAAVITLSRRGSDVPQAPGAAATPPSAGAEPGQAPEEAPTVDTTTLAMQNTATERQTQVLPGLSAPPPPPPYPPAGAVPPEPAPAQPREKSVLGRLTVGVALLVAGTLVALDVADVVTVSAVVVIASALAVVAVGLLVGTLVGRSRGLIALGIGLVLVLIPLSAVPAGIRWNTGEGAGDRTYRVATMADLESEYALGAGSLTLDLRRLDLTTATTVDASVGVGELIVLLPPDVAAQVSSDVGVGEIDLPDTAVKSGVDIEQSWTGQTDAQPVPAPSLDLTLSAGIGSVTVIDPRVTIDTRELSR
jgi:phage shock protein PspC (stress-responsive transcriptional regulator)